MEDPPTLRFGRFELQSRRAPPAAWTARRRPLGARAFDLLLALVERRDRLVTKHELLDVVWPGLVVEENNLQVQVSALRKLLGAAGHRDRSRGAATVSPRRSTAPRGAQRRRAAARVLRPTSCAARAARQPARQPAAAVRPRRATCARCAR